MMFVFAHNLLGWAGGSWEEEQRSEICDIYIDANFQYRNILKWWIICFYDCNNGRWRSFSDKNRFFFKDQIMCYKIQLGNAENIRL